MGRPPCCDKVGIKKGPWTPEEDIILVSYIQEHGPGNWRAVPTNTGLMRCSKSCRLRWTNYLRPGIKRGNFTPHEEGMIIHLQALLGNKWAAIATYLPQRTDNDIKNYWNTHLKKKLKKFQSGLEPSPQMGSDRQYHHQSTANNYHQFMSKNYSHDHDHHDQRGGCANTFENNINLKNNPSVYASSAENISRLLEGWMRSSSISPLQPPNTNSFSYENRDKLINNYSDFGKISTIPNECSDEASGSVLQGYRPQQIEHEGSNGINAAHHDHDLECILSFDHHHNFSSIACDKSSCDSSQKGSESSGFMDHEKVDFVHENKHKVDNHNSNNPPLSFLEKWLLDESAAQVEMELPSIF